MIKLCDAGRGNKVS